MHLCCPSHECCRCRCVLPFLCCCPCSVVSCITDFCWNNATTLPPQCNETTGCVPTVVTAILGEETPCLTDPAQYDALQASLAQISAAVSAAQDSPIEEIVWDIAGFECTVSKRAVFVRACRGMLFSTTCAETAALSSSINSAVFKLCGYQH